MNNLLRHLCRWPGVAEAIVRLYSRTTCSACGAEIPPGKPGRKCKACREKPPVPNTQTIEIYIGQESETIYEADGTV